MKNVASVAFLACVVVFSAMMSEAGPSEVPATRPARLPIPKDESPREAMLRNSKIAEARDLDQLMDFYVHFGETEDNWARLNSEYEIAIARAQLAIRAKWGQTADDSFIHALGEITDGDLMHARIIYNADVAVIMYREQQGPPPLVLEKVKGEWKLPVRRVLAPLTAADLDSVTDSMKIIRDGMPKIVDDIKSGKISSADEAAAAAKKLADEAYATPDTAKK